MLALAAALLLAAAPLPFPAPRMATVTEATKFDPGTVVAYDATRGELRVRCADGLVTFLAGGDVQVFNRDGTPLGPPSKLVAGQKVRVWYVVDHGARVLEIAVE